MPIVPEHGYYNVIGDFPEKYVPFEFLIVPQNKILTADEAARHFNLREGCVQVVQPGCYDYGGCNGIETDPTGMKVNGNTWLILAQANMAYEYPECSSS